MEFKVRETQAGYYIDVYLKGQRVIEGSNVYWKDVADDIVRQLIFEINRDNRIY